MLKFVFFYAALAVCLLAGVASMLAFVASGDEWALATTILSFLALYLGAMARPLIK